MPSDISALIGQIPYEERATGGQTTQMLAKMLAQKMVDKLDRSLTFQKNVKQQNRDNFNPPMNLPPANEPGQVDEHPMTPPWQPLDQMETPQAAPQQMPGEESGDEGSPFGE